jgi:hypothetical protein
MAFMPPTDFSAVAMRLVAIINGLLLATAMRFAGVRLGQPAAARLSCRLEHLRDGILRIAAQAQARPEGTNRAAPASCSSARRRSRIAGRGPERATRHRQKRAAPRRAKGVQHPRRPIPLWPPPPAANLRLSRGGCRKYRAARGRRAA